MTVRCAVVRLYQKSQMGKRKYLPLTPFEVKAIVVAPRFRHRRTQGAHAHYEREAGQKYPRSIVTIDEHYAEFDAGLIKSMIGQPRHTRDDTYGDSAKCSSSL